MRTEERRNSAVKEETENGKEVEQKEAEAAKEEATEHGQKEEPWSTFFHEWRHSTRGR